MKLIRNLCIVALIMIVFDTFAGVVSRHINFDYRSLMLLSNLLNIAIGYWGASQHGFRYGILSGAFAGLIDSTLGWLISIQISPFYIEDKTVHTFTSVLLSIIMVTAQGAFCGLVGAIIHRLLDREK